MTLSKHKANASRARFAVASLAALALLVALPGNAQAVATPVPLGTADSFVVLAGAGITNTVSSTLNGDIGTFPNPAITGMETVTLNGANHAGDLATQGAQAALGTAYDTAVVARRLMCGPARCPLLRCPATIEYVPPPSPTP